VKAELREMTKREEVPERAVVRSSVIPSAKYSCSGSPLMFAKGNTTIEGRSGRAGASEGKTPRASSATPSRRGQSAHIASAATITITPTARAERGSPRRGVATLRGGSPALASSMTW
jgi:hypothetical protein